MTHWTIRLLALLLTIFLLTGLMTRTESDDYCVAGLVDATQHAHSDIPAFIDSMYNGWNGRFSQLIFQSLVQRIDPLANMLMPGVFILTGLFLLNRLVNNWLYALVGVVAFLLALPALHNTLFWLSGSFTYIPPILLFMEALFLFRQKRHPAWLFGIGLVAGGFSESLTLTMALLWLLMGNNGGRRSIAFLCGLMLAFVVMYNAPGNDVRSQYFSGGLSAAFDSAAETLPTIAHLIRLGLAGCLLAFTAGCFYPVRVSLWRAVGAWAVALLITAATLFILGYAAGYYYRPERTFSLCAALLVAAFLYTGSAFGERLSSQRKWLLLPLLVVLLVVPFEGLVDKTRYAIEWHSRDALLRAGQTEVPALASPEHTLDETTVHYVNICAAAWYGLPEITVETTPENQE